jgi:predicted porin
MKAVAAVYLGGNFGYTNFGSNVTDQYQISSSGKSYGALVGFKVQFLGIEGFYQRLNSMGDISHNSVKYKLVNNATAIGGALRINLNLVYLRAGYSTYTVEEGINNSDGVSQNNTAMNRIYEVSAENGHSTGGIFGGGFQFRFGKKLRLTLDFTRYNLSTLNSYYNVATAGVVINLPDVNLARAKDD